MKSYTLRFILSFLLLLTLHSLAFAEFITMTDGKTYEGDIEFFLNEEKPHINIKDKSRTLAIYELDKIYSIVPKQNGEHISYHKNGNIYREATLKDGKLNGPMKTYSEDGKLITEVMYVDHNIEGLYKTFFPNGTVSQTETYKENILEGVYKKYSEDGFLLEEGNYVDGQLDGTTKFYYRNGKVQKEIDYSNGAAQYPYRTYDINGNLINQVYLNEPSGQETNPAEKTLTPIEKFMKEKENNTHESNE